MAKLIDAEKLKTEIRDDPEIDGWNFGRMKMHIEDAEEVDAVEVVHGRWIGTQYDGYADGCPVYDLWECSECREEYESEGDPPPYNYCPNCGAKMDGDGNG